MTPTNQQLLADTNVLSYLFNNHSLGLAYQDIISDNDIAICFQTLGELRYGAFKSNWGQPRQEALERFIQAFAVVYPTDAVCTRWAQIRAELRSKGRVIAEGDAWIAATAVELSVPLVTHNRAHFAGIPGLSLISQST